MMDCSMQRIHGAANEKGQALFDFSTNANACGACPPALAAVQNADAAHYPDFTYTALRRALADFHGVAIERIVLAGSASEFIFRITAFTARAAQQRKKSVWIPRHAYGDYAHAAHAWGLERVADIAAADLVWACEPSSPLGQAHTAWAHSPTATVVLDCAYAPLRLSGQPSLNTEALKSHPNIWQLYSPNKALALTGIRAAYAIAPHGAEAMARTLNDLAPSWVVGAHGVAMLMAWTQSPTQNWLAQTLPILREWKAHQIALLKNHGWACEPSDANFFCARPPAGIEVETLCHDLRQHGIQLRNAASFGLAGWVRLGVREPLAQAALHQRIACKPPVP